MIDVASISAGLASIKAAKELVSGAFSATVDAEVKAKVMAAMDQLGKAQDTMYELREELFRLQDENRTMKRAAEDAERDKNVIAQYDLVTTIGGAMVYESKIDPKHYACPTCMVGAKVSILQPINSHVGGMRCEPCKVTYRIKPDPPVKLPAVIHRTGRGGIY